MKKHYFLQFKIMGILCLILLATCPAFAQWELAKECKAAYAVYVTKNGNMLMSDYLFDQTGGIYLSTDQGKTWEKTKIADHNYNTFIEAGDYVFAAGIGGCLARSADQGKTWELVYYTEPLKKYLSAESLDYDVVYAITYHNGKLFVGDFIGGGILYSEDFGETWTLTKRDNLMLVYEDKETGKSEKYMDNFYNLVSFDGKLLAFGMINVYLYDEKTNDWTITRYDSNVMAVSTVFKDKLYCGRSIMNETDKVPFIERTADGLNWEGVNRPEGQLDNNIRALASDENNIYAGLQTRGIYYSSNEGKSWVNISKGLPYFMEQVPDQFLSPLKFAVDKDYVYVIIYDVPFSDRNESGLYRYAKNALPTGIEDLVNYDETQLYTNNTHLYAVNGSISEVKVFTIDGKSYNVNLIDGKADIQYFPAGCYLYEAVVGQKQFTGKFIKR